MRGSNFKSPVFFNDTLVRSKPKPDLKFKAQRVPHTRFRG